MMRESKEYKKLNSYLACAIAEGFCEGEDATYDEQLAAWQYIYDHRMYRHLQGWFGRRLQELVNAGLIETT